VSAKNGRPTCSASQYNYETLSKFLPDYHAYPADGLHYAPALEYPNAHGLCVLVHTWGGSAFNSPQQVEIVARRYSNARLLLGHSGFGDWEFSAALARDVPNVYLDLTAVYASHDFSVLPAGSGTPSVLGSAVHVNGVIEYFVGIAGSRKVLLGTDLPWYSPDYAAGAVLYARIGEEDKHNILHRNAEKLLEPICRCGRGSVGSVRSFRKTAPRKPGDDDDERNAKLAAR